MEGRCAVETWAEFGFSGSSCTPKIRFGVGTDVFLCPGSDEVCVFSTQERKLTIVIQFPGPVSDLVASHDKQLLFVACRSGVYCVSLQSLLSRAQSPPADTSSSPAVLKISSEFLLVPEEGVLSLLLVGSVLLTLSQRDASWMLTLYNSTQLSASSSCEMLTSFSFPLALGVVHSDGKTGRRRRPVLICVLLETSETILTDDHFCLEPVLFKLLFGIDAALAKSPVILCGLPDGCLCFLPLSLPGSRLRVLHSLEQPVVFVGASVVTETGPGHAQCLVAVGELGRVVLIKTEKGGPEGGGNIAAFIERCVPAPVMCGRVDKNCLYYSTGSDLLVLDLSEGPSGRDGQERDVETSRNTGFALQSPNSLNVCRVIALAEPTCNTAGEVQLLGLSVRGQLQRISLPAGREDARSSKVASTQVSRGVRDLLSAIGDVCESAGGESSSVNFSFPFHNLHAGETLEVSLPLAAAGDASFPMTVSCSLVFSLSSLLGQEAANLPHSHSRCISLPLNTLTVDWLHALWVDSPATIQKTAASQCNNTAVDTIQAFLSSRRMRCRGGGQGGEQSPSNPEREQQHSASVRVSSELLRDTLVLKSSGLDPQGASLAPQNVCLSLLEWLLSEGPGGVRTGHQGDKISSSVVHARGPNGHTVKLTVKEVKNDLQVNVGEESVGKESPTTVEVQVESSSIAAVCGLHHAVLRRVQTLLQRAPERTASTNRVQSLALRQALQRAEHLLQQIQQSRVSGAFGGGAPTGPMTRSLLAVYRELRENPLLII